jgi:hypothetical protein
MSLQYDDAAFLFVIHITFEDLTSFGIVCHCSILLVGGGVLLAGKGIGKGITTGDGAAVASGLGNGAMSIGKGVGTGIETIAVGAADGVVSVGKGVFKGVNQVAKGIGGVFSRNNR